MNLLQNSKLYSYKKTISYHTLVKLNTYRKNITVFSTITMAKTTDLFNQSKYTCVILIDSKLHIFNMVFRILTIGDLQ